MTTDIYLDIADQPEDVINSVAEAMEVRANDPAMRAITHRYLSTVPAVHRGLEVGCGAGISTLSILDHVHPDELVAVDPSLALVERARRRLAGDARVRIEVATASATGEPDASADTVFAHTVLSHLADPASAISEARRVLRPGGRLVIFDGDYASLAVSRYESDPLQATVEIAKRHLVHNPYLVRTLPQFLADAGFELELNDAFGYVGTQRSGYFLSVIARGLTAAMAVGEVGEAFVQGALAEVRRRIETGTFHASALFMSFVARRAH